MSRTPREVAELVHRMVEGGDGIEFADLFAEDGVLEYPFFVPGYRSTVAGRASIREFFAARKELRGMFDLEQVTSEVYQTDDPEVVVTEIVHRGRSHVTNAPYELRALGIIRVRAGEIVHYRDYLNPISLAQLIGRVPDLIAALGAEPATAGRAGS
ncbi:MAG TPA: nuclear transport factor 2 family protein [Actinophytocola sp.]|uniref:nuclear transport factor 2 family protein n=1 Tax=Actinophytocola sp. TaxID=1872138 RepID=UPI002DB9F174|nr:nuclear transport factor 2 family protein [Actinophytocola sp.]HEU5476069.1 nuclear transport factor 2 family protein [Actinophytocola sp.]